MVLCLIVLDVCSQTQIQLVFITFLGVWQGKWHLPYFPDEEDDTGGCEAGWWQSYNQTTGAQLCPLLHPSSSKSLKQVLNFYSGLHSQSNLCYLCFPIAVLHSFPCYMCRFVCLCICQPAGDLLSDSPRPGRIWSVGGQDNGSGQCGLTTSGEQPKLMC